MARIKNFVSPAQGRNRKLEFEHKIRAYRRGRAMKIISVTTIVALIIAAIVFLWKNSVYTSYTEISSFPRVSSSNSSCLNHNGRILSYSKDGINCVDTKGNMIWNETYQMQKPIVEVNENAVAVGDYDGHIIYVMDEKGKVGEIDTHLPIKDLCVSKTGIVAVVLEDHKVTRLNLYNAKGKELVKSESRMNQNGYPIAVALSDTGEVMEVSYLYVDSGTMKSSVAFYNFSDVGQNSVDRLVSGNEYADTVVPYIGFSGKDTAYAVGNNRISFYQGADKPVSIAEKLLSEEIQAVYTGDEYVGLIYIDTTGAALYRMDVYDKKGNLVLNQSIDIEYQKILIQKNNIVVYNNTECVMYSMSGKEKYRGTFGKSVSLLIPANKINRFIMVTSDSIDIIELN
ncbi:MAG: hypothetical protein IKW30_04040 [Lachnospiraceae bacterium]|nr:hypothetical protein [Lachnospiraceae bacterium]